MAAFCHCHAVHAQVASGGAWYAGGVSLPRLPLLLALLCVGLAACQTSSERRLFESCEATPECSVGLDCVVLRSEPGATTAGAGFCTFRCAPRFPCSDVLACTDVDSEGIVVATGAAEARNAFCLRPCGADRDCATGLSCEATAAGRVCL